MFRARAFTVGLLTTLVFHAGMASFFLVLALYLQQGLGLTALASGEIFTVLALGYVAASLYAPRLMRRWGRQTLAAGALVMAAGLILLRLTVARLGVVGQVVTLSWAGGEFRQKTILIHVCIVLSRSRSSGSDGLPYPIVQVCHTGPFDDPRTLQFDGRTRQVVEEPDTLAEQHGYQVDHDFV